eukprot:scaffold1850_cov164-Alexandrium_tamarense.AAC.2
MRKAAALCGESERDNDDNDGYSLRHRGATRMRKAAALFTQMIWSRKAEVDDMLFASPIKARKLSVQS